MDYDEVDAAREILMIQKGAGMKLRNGFSVCNLGRVRIDLLALIPTSLSSQVLAHTKKETMQRLRSLGWAVLSASALCTACSVPVPPPGTKPSVAVSVAAVTSVQEPAAPTNPHAARVTHIEHEPRPGENFGLPKEEAVQLLDPQMRTFLDGVLRVYQEPGLFGNRQAVLDLLGLKVQQRFYFKSEGQPRPRFREDLAGTGILERPGWNGYVYYEGIEKGGALWRGKLEFEINKKEAKCINSKAIEGYMEDVFWYPRKNLNAHKFYWAPDEWDRHGIVGGMYANSLTEKNPFLGMDFIGGCISRMSIGRGFLFKEMSDDKFYN